MTTYQALDSSDLFLSFKKQNNTDNTSNNNQNNIDSLEQKYENHLERITNLQQQIDLEEKELRICLKKIKALGKETMPIPKNNIL